MENLGDICIQLKKSNVGVLPTDTLYGVVCSAFDRDAVERVYQIKGRDKQKPLIILIKDIADLEIFNVKLLDSQQNFLQEVWPGKVTVILRVEGDFDYLTRGGSSLAFRLPDDKNLIDLLKCVGPIVAPSANPEGAEPAKTIEEAKKYFDNAVDFYVDGGVLAGEPSTIVAINDEKIELIRQGSQKILDIL